MGDNLVDSSALGCQAGAWEDLDGYFQSPHDAPPSWLLMMTAYLDESGHESKDWMFLAGFLGKEENWKEFVPKWKAALGPQRKALHMADLRWNQDRTRKLLEKLGVIPEAVRLTPVLAGVRYGDYQDLVIGSREEKALKGYMCCLCQLVTQILRIVPPNERLEIVFEEQRQYAPYANIMLGLLADTVHGPTQWNTTHDGKAKLAKWSFVPKGSTIMTDAADYFAYALRESWINQKSKKARWWESIMRTADGNGIGWIMDRQKIRYQISEKYILAAYEQIERMKSIFQG